MKRTELARTFGAACLCLISFSMGATSGLADERLRGIACRSVHLAYAGDETVAFYNEVTPLKSAPGTFFMVCGWNTGYFGLQELGNGKKLLIFSVWDNARGDDPQAVAEEDRVELLHQDEAVRVGRFGGEGTGGQSFLDFDWSAGETYRFMVTAQPDGHRTQYSGHFFDSANEKWIKLVTFSTVTSKRGSSGQKMRGFYSFVEDFKRDRKSTEATRRAAFGNGWICNAKLEWTPLTEARFTADANPVLNIDAGPYEDRFFLATGGEIENTTVKLRDKMVAQGPSETCPADVQNVVQEIVRAMVAHAPERN